MLIFRLCFFVKIFSLGWCVIELFLCRILIRIVVGFSLVSVARL